MSAYETRASLLQIAETLNGHRLAIAKVIAEINEATAMLVSKAEDLLPLAVSEKEEGTTKKAVRYTKPEDVQPSPQVAFIGEQGNKRACGNPWCGQLGHNKRTCPTVRPDTPLEREPKPVKAKRTITPERKAQLVASLAKARAARKK